MKNTRILLSLLFLLLYTAAYAKHIPVKVSGIVDGDTISVIFNGKREKVRLIGIDTPESRYNYKTKRDSERSGQDIRTIITLGKRATRFVKSLVSKGGTVSLEFDAQQRDRYGRLLAYVYLPNGRMLNDIIIRSGYAVPMTIPPNVAYRDRFLDSYRYAREKGVGFWR